MDKPKLIIVCGPTASGKSTVSQLVQKLAPTKLAYIDHDYFREVVFQTSKTESRELRFKINIGSIKLAIEEGWDVIYDTTLGMDKLSELINELGVLCNFEQYKFYLEASLEEVLLRHSQRPKANEFGDDYIKEWYPGFKLLRQGSIILEQDLNIEEKANIILKKVYGEDFKKD